MEFWDGRERNISPYSKYQTLPGWNSSSQIYNKSPSALCPESKSESRGWIGEPNNWTIPGSRTGGTLRDCINWTDMIPSLNYSAENQELSVYSGHERGIERHRFQREKGRLVPREDLGNKWQLSNSTLYRKEKEKAGSNSYRELEAWANRYYHSLPRQRQVEAGKWSTTQSLHDYDRIQGSTCSLQSPEPNQMPYISAPYSHEKFNRFQLDTRKTQQLPYIPAKSLPRKTSASNSKENMILSPSFSHPPSYTPPPPYVIRHVAEVQQLLDKATAKSNAAQTTEHQLGHGPVNSTFSMLRRRESSLDSWSTERTPKNLAYLDTDSIKNLESLTSQRPIQKQEEFTPHPTEHSFPDQASIYPEIQLPKLSKPKRKRGGETVFCLVSRMGELAGLSSSPEEPLKSHPLPLLKPSAPGGLECTDKKANIDHKLVQLEDEIDSGALDDLMSIKKSTPESHTRESQSQIVDQGNLQEKPGEKASFLTSKKDSESTKHKENTDLQQSSKTVAETMMAPSNQTTIKFPLWKEPKWHYCSKGVLEKENKPNLETGNMGQCQQVADGQPKLEETSSNSYRDKNRGLVVIDATCVVVKVEFIFPPEKEHVQYVCSRSTDSYEHVSKVKDNRDYSAYTAGVTEDSPMQEILVKIQEEPNDKSMNMGQMSNDTILVKENETLKERAERILGITLQNPSNEGYAGLQTTQIENTDVLKIQGGTSQQPKSSSENGVDHVDGSEKHLRQVDQSEEAETEAEEIIMSLLTEKEIENIVTNAGGTLEGSEMNLISPLKTIHADEIMDIDVTKQESEDISKEITTTFDDKLPTIDTKELKDNIDKEFNERPSEEPLDAKQVLPIFLDNYVEINRQNLTLIVANPSCDTEDIQNLKSTSDFIGDTSVKFGQEGALNEDNLSDTTKDQESNFKDGSSSYDPDDVNNICLVLTGNKENINEFLEGQEGSSGEGKPPKTVDDDQESSQKEDNLPDETNDIQNPCSTLFGRSVEDTYEWFSQEASYKEENPSSETSCPSLTYNNTSEIFEKESNSNEGNLFDKTDSTDNLCQDIAASCVENSSQSLGQKCRTKDISDETDDIENVCPSPTDSSLDNCRILIDEEGGFMEVTPSNETDDLKIICPLVPHDNVENPCREPFDKESVSKKVTLADETDDLQNLCPSLKVYSEFPNQERTTRECTHLVKTDEVNGLCLSPPGNNKEKEVKPFAVVNAHICPPILENLEDATELFGQKNTYHSTEDLGLPLIGKSLENTTGLFSQERGSREDISSVETDHENNLYPVFSHETFKFGKQFGKEGNFFDEIDTNDNICQQFLEGNNPFFGQENSNMDISDRKDGIQSNYPNPSEFLGQESRPWEGSISDQSIELINPCLPLGGISVEDTRELFCQKMNEDISPLSKKEATSLESLTCSSALVQNLDKSLLAPTFTMSLHSEHQPDLPTPPSSDTYINQEFLSVSSVNSTFPSPPLPPLPEVFSAGISSSSKSIKENQYPKSLWDAVNRIRRHTAPDSENEEEEGVEIWEQTELDESELGKWQAQESFLEERMEKFDTKDASIASNVVNRMASDCISLEEVGIMSALGETKIQPEEIFESKDVGQTEDDTLSSSSRDSHDSKGTVIRGEGSVNILETDKEELENEEVYAVDNTE